MQNLEARLQQRAADRILHRLMLRRRIVARHLKAQNAMAIAALVRTLLTSMLSADMSVCARVEAMRASACRAVRLASASGVIV